MSVELKTQPCHETFLGLTATFDFGLPDQRYLRFRAGMEVSHYKAVLCYFLILKCHVFRLYFCADSSTEDAYIATHPRPSGPVNVNSTQLCGALGKLSQCEEETECKEMAKGLLYTTASVSTLAGFSLLKKLVSFRFNCLAIAYLIPHPRNRMCERLR